jgi:integrase
MESLLKVPTKFSRCGIKVKCLKCKWQLNGKTCHQDRDKPQSLSKCQHKDQHRYNLVVSVPNGDNARRMKVLDTRNFDVAIEEMNRFKQALNVNGYHKTEEKIEVARPTFVSYVCEYLNSMSNVNTPLHLVRKITPKHLTETTTVLKRFSIAMKKGGYNIEIMNLKDINDRHVELFYKYINFELKLSNVSYNKYFTIMKAFYNWCIKVKECDIRNPFAKAKLVFEKHDNRIFTRCEFERILLATTPENGTSTRSKENRNYYRPWLVDAYRLCLETGMRSDYINLKWDSLITLENGVEIFGVSNLKVNRIKTGEDTGKYLRYIPVTKSLKKLLIELGYNEKKGTDAYLLEAGGEQSRKYLSELITRSFSWFAMKADITGLSIKHLRKTYITKLTMAMGSLAKTYTGHSNEAVLQNHYLSQAYLTSNLKEFDVLQ